MSEETLAKLGLIAGPLPAALAATAPLFLLGYHLTRKKHARIIAELEERRGRDAAAIAD
jgi:Na+/melibiose symporter-like transporter